MNKITFRKSIRIQKESKHGELDRWIKPGDTIEKSEFGFLVKQYRDNYFNESKACDVVDEETGAKLWAAGLSQIEGLPIVTMYNSILWTPVNFSSDKIYFQIYRTNAYKTTDNYEIFGPADIFSSPPKCGEFCSFTEFEKEHNSCAFGRIQNMQMYTAAFARMFTLSPITAVQFLELKDYLLSNITALRNELNVVMEKWTLPDFDMLFAGPSEIKRNEHYLFSRKI